MSNHADVRASIGPANISCMNTVESYSTSDHQFVVDYLKQKKFFKTLNALADDSANFAESEDIKLPKTPSASSYEESYCELWEWIGATLDSIKPELSAILYPLFIHCYLSMIENGYIKSAVQFISNHAHEHSAENYDEIQAIASVKSIEHFKQSEHVALWRKNKYIIKMSDFSFGILKAFLKERNFLFLFYLLATHIHIKLFNGFPQPKDFIDHTRAIIPNSNIDFTSPIYLHVGPEQRQFFSPPESPINSYDEVDMEDVTSESYKKRKREEMKIKKKLKILEAEWNDPINAEDRRRKCPLPEIVPADLKFEIYNDRMYRLPLSNSQLPSICFYTVFNNYGSMNCSRISYDAGLIVSGHSDSTIKIWDMQKNSRWAQAESKFIHCDGRNSKYMKKNFQFSELNGHFAPVYSVDFSTDNSYILSASGDGTARLWSTDTKVNVVSYRGHTHPVWQAKFSPSNYYFATASNDRTARLWVTSNLKPLRIFAGHISDVNTVAFHPNNYYLLTGSSDKTVRLWDLATGECVRLFLGHTVPIYSSHISIDGRLALSSGDGTIIVWDLNNGEKVSVLKGHEGIIWSMDVSYDGNILASGSSDCSVRLWDIRMISDVLNGTKLEITPPPKKVLLESGALEANKINKAALGVYPTKSTPVYNVQFTRRNLLLASGPFTKQNDDE